MYRIEKGIPIPKLPKNNSMSSIGFAYIPNFLRKMKRGNSVVVESRNRYITFNTAANRLGFTITGRKIIKGKHQGKYRIWLLSK
jgi:hypothetical protein